jgi:hypothetical protein
LIKTHPKQKAPIFLGKLLDRAAALVAANQEKGLVVCAVINQELRLFEAIEVYSFGAGEIIEFLRPIDKGVV